MNTKKVICLAVAGILGLTGCFAKHTVAKLWTPDQANLEVDHTSAAPNETTNQEEDESAHSIKDTNAFVIDRGQPTHQALRWRRIRVIVPSTSAHDDSLSLLALFKGRQIIDDAVDQPRLDFQFIGCNAPHTVFRRCWIRHAMTGHPNAGLHRARIFQPFR